jgi:Tfp pilus assembly protein PilF
MILRISGDAVTSFSVQSDDETSLAKAIADVFLEQEYNVEPVLLAPCSHDVLDKYYLFSLIYALAKLSLQIIRNWASITSMRDKIFLLLFILTAIGCAADSTAVPKYETVTVNPRRDSEVAAKQNQHGLEALAKGKLDKAEKHFKEALIKDVDFGPAHNNLGRLYFDQGKNYLAAWEFEYAAKVTPQRGEPYNNLGLVMERVGKLEQAIDAYETANILCPNHPEVVGNLARVHWRQDKSNRRTRDLLEQLIFIDTRSDWVSWAKEQIACGKISNEVLPVSFISESSTIPVNPPPASIPVPILPPSPNVPQYPGSTPTLAPPSPLTL